MPQRLPWLLSGLRAGVIADRFDRKAIITAANVTVVEKADLGVGNARLMGFG